MYSECIVHSSQMKSVFYMIDVKTINSAKKDNLQQNVIPIGH